MTGSLQSDINLEFRCDERNERTFLYRRRAGGLCHLSKPYWDGSVLGLQLVNPTAGLFSGDHLAMRVKIGDGAKVALTSPSATRYHTMPEGRAEIRQDFSVGSNAWLDYWPEIVIPQNDSDVRQVTKIDVAKGSDVAFFDSLAPGRVAHGENSIFRRLETVLEITVDGELLVKERCVLEPETTGHWPLEIQGWDICYYGALWIIGPQAEEVLARMRKNRGSIEEGFFVGSSVLAPNVMVTRLLCRSSLLLKKLAQDLRQEGEKSLPFLKTDFRKL